MKILLAITFVYGIIQLLTQLKIFKHTLYNILESLSPWENKPWMQYLDILFRYFSLVFQAYYWLFK